MRPRLPRQRRRHHAGADEAIAHAGVLVVDLAQPVATSTPMASDALRERAAGVRREIAARAAGHHEIHQIALARGPFGRAQQLLLEPGELRQPEGESGIVAERAEIAQMIGEALELERKRAQPRARAPAAASPAMPFERLAVGPGEGHGGIAGDARREAMAVQRCAAR